MHSKLYTVIYITCIRSSKFLLNCTELIKLHQRLLYTHTTFMNLNRKDPTNPTSLIFLHHHQTLHYLTGKSWAEHHILVFGFQTVKCLETSWRHYKKYLEINESVIILLLNIVKETWTWIFMTSHTCTWYIVTKCMNLNWVPSFNMIIQHSIHVSLCNEASYM